MYFVYILYSPTAERYYVGQTNHLQYRLRRHNEGCARSTKAYCPWQLKYCEAFATRSQSMRREREIKNQKSRNKLEALIESAQLAESRGRD